jgi:hypothetical protein
MTKATAKKENRKCQHRFQRYLGPIDLLFTCCKSVSFLSSDRVVLVQFSAIKADFYNNK